MTQEQQNMQDVQNSVNPEFVFNHMTLRMNEFLRETVLLAAMVDQQKRQIEILTQQAAEVDTQKKQIEGLLLQIKSLQEGKEASKESSREGLQNVKN